MITAFCTNQNFASKQQLHARIAPKAQSQRDCAAVPENRLISRGEPGVVGVGMSVHHALLLALEALMDPSQAVGTIKHLLHVL